MPKRPGAAVSPDPWQRLEAAAAGWGVEFGQSQRTQLEKYLHLVQEHNQRVNLTAERSWEGLLLRHAADGLAAAGALKRRIKVPAPRIADVGSGAGFVGLPLKIAWPEAELTLVESSLRRFEFLNLASLALGLKGLKVLRRKAGADRIEPAPFDAAIERALAPLPAAVKLLLPLVRSGGLFAAYQSQAPERDPAVLEAAAQSGGKWLETWPYRLPGEEKDRFLALFAREERSFP
ncbi:MAG: 16S rRNA (guanine(527)-N(7))-methyltransferase RsmG [Elusimicrobia bacterium]|nr:16S rRNA (guanine(527)-N(7))-methyltransferase RsmG [Elusimicrobiota bacterium]